MTKRERKWLKGDKWMSFMEGKPFKVSARHWFMQRRCARMQTWEYIRWKQQQIIQSEFNEVINLRSQDSSFEIIRHKLVDCDLVGLKPMFVHIYKGLVAYLEKQNQAPDDERSVATNPQ